MSRRDLCRSSQPWRQRESRSRLLGARGRGLHPRPGLGARHRADGGGVPQLPDRVVGQAAPLGQDLVGVLAEQWRGAAGRQRVAVEADRAGEVVAAPGEGMLESLEEAAPGQLAVAVERLDRRDLGGA